ncbi:pyruvate kinase PKM [Biomphalaria pfeifferi]|uniref:Pyruvate kinase n=1 Tax=Biomphalaria pfeifferi TaxID=112525 RepID=A0AAD8FMB8_BIOPF|nr:pyruvate kinase PKM [Biomphalaria pfeifferi]
MATIKETMPKDQQLLSFVTSSFLERNALLNIDSVPAVVRQTHIICTIGPASREVDMLSKLMDVGMNICRLNFSHGSYDYHAGTVQNIREAASRRPKGSVIAIALDTKGPEIRTGVLEGGATAEVNLDTGSSLTVTVNDSFREKCSAQTLWVDYKKMIQVLSVGNLIYVDDGLISLKVTEKGSDYLKCIVVNGGKLGSKKGCNLPNTPIDLPAVSGKDKQDLLFGLDQNVDMVFASFIQDGNGIREIRQVLGEKGRHIKIIAKIESFEGIRNFPDILKECDGVMVARGDMGIEIPPEKVFIAQKYLISACNMFGKPVICATQMLESMTNKPRATRAESNDVANAVLDGADCVMLSGESAKGLYPIEAVMHMSSVCLEAESVFHSRHMFGELRRVNIPSVDPTHSLAISTVAASYTCMAVAIIVITESGRAAHLVSRYKPRCPIVMVTHNESIAKQSLLYRGVNPIYVPSTDNNWQNDMNVLVQEALGFCHLKELNKHNEPILLLIGLVNGSDQSNCLQVITSKPKSK